jgi:hypothetical protein
MKLSDYLVTNKPVGANKDYSIIPRIKCVDGFTMSVQCHSGSYCSPRRNDSNYYSQVEVGFPSEAPRLFMRYAEDYDNPTDTVYGYVPIEIVAAEINSHGGIVGVGLLDDVICDDEE